MHHNIQFSKLSGSGNDFIVVDNRQGTFRREELPRVARTLCRRNFSIGADGFIALESSDTADFRWQFFNADGSVAEMCGNGGRCAARYASEKGIAGPRLCFETLAGRIRAEVKGKRVKLELPPAGDLRTSLSIPLASGSRKADFINSGVPHVVIVADRLEEVEVDVLGREIRYHPMFAPAGTNVNFIRKLREAKIEVRTFERGVEGETQACGTGAVAAALIASIRWRMPSPIAVETRGGEVLDVYFVAEGAGFSQVFLEGDTLWVYDGELHEEALASG
ncbi:MAG: diaminopimelate epimerase [bacterium]